MSTVLTVEIEVIDTVCAEQMAVKLFATGACGAAGTSVDETTVPKSLVLAW